MRWLREPSVAAVTEALGVVAPRLSDRPVALPPLSAKGSPRWWSGSAAVGDDHFAKFAWSRTAAKRLATEIAVLAALDDVPYLPEVAATATDPLLLVTRRSHGDSLFRVIDGIDPDRAGAQIAAFLSALHRPESLAAVEAGGHRLPPAHQGVHNPAATADLRERLAPLIRPEQRDALHRWCDWTDAVLRGPGPEVLTHGDFHGNNQVWDGERLVAVLDFETAARAEPEFDLRGIPGTGPGVALLRSVIDHYGRMSGRALSPDRVMAWHTRTALGDVLWRSEAGIHLADHRTPADWMTALAKRFAALGIRAVP